MSEHVNRLIALAESVVAVDPARSTDWIRGTVLGALNEAFDLGMVERGRTVLIAAADAMDADPEFRDPLRLKSDWLRRYAEAVDGEL